jgi:hypothetical protein
MDRSLVRWEQMVRAVERANVEGPAMEPRRVLEVSMLNRVRLAVWAAWMGIALTVGGH